MAAVLVRAALPGGAVGRVPALTTATPGVFVRRVRAGEVCDAESCVHPWVHGQWYEHCPDAGWQWWVVLACGLSVAGGFFGFETKAAALAYAEALGGWPVDWAAGRDELAGLALSTLGQEHLWPWLRAAFYSLEYGSPGSSEHWQCSTCPPLPSVTASAVAR